MATTTTKFKCLIISPSDVEAEREAVTNAIHSWNAHAGDFHGALIEPVRWESHATPSMGGAAQDIINTDLVDQCDFGIAIFWSRLGSPTQNHPSGSAEEVDRILGRGGKVMVYFGTRPVPQASLQGDQYIKLQALKQKYQTEGLYWTYDTVENLRSLVSAHLLTVIGKLLSQTRSHGQLTPTAGAETATVPRPDVRVRAKSGTVLQGNWRRDVIAITVENHSPSKFFFSTLSLEIEGQEGGLFAASDFITGESLTPRAIEPGDAFTFYYGIDKIKQSLQGHALKDAVVLDKIGREFRSGPGELGKAFKG
ncbi:MAG: hypothetical protein EOP84_04990 [Verrucomicrobiaceae bacterium]|nr:MAG: hypothetical protein EOP84_04990 [Verrucomicrobiaceae bacterium]